MLDWCVHQKEILRTIFWVKTWIKELVSYEVSFRDAHQYFKQFFFSLCQNDCLAQDLLQAYRNTRPFVHTMIGNGIMEADLREAFDFMPKRHVLLCQNRGFSNVGCDGNRFVWVQTSQALETTVDFLQSAEAQLLWILNDDLHASSYHMTLMVDIFHNIKVKLELGFSQLRRGFDVAKRWFLCHRHFQPLSVPSKRQGYWFPLAVGVRSHRAVWGMADRNLQEHVHPNELFNGLVKLT